MTKKEFVQRTAIAMAGNPRFTGKAGLDATTICMESARLANNFEDLWCDDYPFDEEEEMPIHVISESIEEIRHYINNPSDDPGKLSTLQELAQSLNDIEFHQEHLANK